MVDYLISLQGILIGILATLNLILLAILWPNFIKALVVIFSSIGIAAIAVGAAINYSKAPLTTSSISRSLR